MVWKSERWNDIVESSNTEGKHAPVEPQEICIKYTYGEDVEKSEIVWEDTAEAAKPRILVSLNSVMKLKKLCEHEHAKYDDACETLNRCRTAYYKEIRWLRDQLHTVVNSSQNSRPKQGQRRGSISSVAQVQKQEKEYEDKDFEVYWFQPPKYIDTELQEFLKTCIRETHKRLIEEIAKLKAQASEDEALAREARATMAKFMEAKLEIEELEKMLESEKFRTHKEKERADGLEVQNRSLQDRIETLEGQASVLEKGRSQLAQAQNSFSKPLARIQEELLAMLSRSLGQAAGKNPLSTPAADLDFDGLVEHMGQAGKDFALLRAVLEEEKADVEAKLKASAEEAKRIEEMRRQHADELENVRRNAGGAERKDLENRLQSEQERAAKFEDESTRLLSELSEEQKRSAALTAELNSFRESADGFRRDIDRLTDDLENERKKLREAGSEERRQQLELQLKEKIDEVEAIQQELEKAEQRHSSAMEEQAQTIQTLKDEIESLRRKLAKAKWEVKNSAGATPTKVASSEMADEEEFAMSDGDSCSDGPEWERNFLKPYRERNTFGKRRWQLLAEDAEFSRRKRDYEFASGNAFVDGDAGHTVIDPTGDAGTKNSTQALPVAARSSSLWKAKAAFSFLTAASRSNSFQHCHPASATPAQTTIPDTAKRRLLASTAPALDAAGRDAANVSNVDHKATRGRQSSPRQPQEVAAARRRQQSPRKVDEMRAALDAVNSATRERTWQQSPRQRASIAGATATSGGQLSERVAPATAATVVVQKSEQQPQVGMATTGDTGLHIEAVVETVASTIMHHQQSKVPSRSVSCAPDEANFVPIAITSASMPGKVVVPFGQQPQSSSPATKQQHLQQHHTPTAQLRRASPSPRRLSMRSLGVTGRTSADVAVVDSVPAIDNPRPQRPSPHRHHSPSPSHIADASRPAVESVDSGERSQNIVDWVGTSSMQTATKEVPGLFKQSPCAPQSSAAAARQSDSRTDEAAEAKEDRSRNLDWLDDRVGKLCKKDKMPPMLVRMSSTTSAAFPRASVPSTQHRAATLSDIVGSTVREGDSSGSGGKAFPSAPSIAPSPPPPASMPVARSAAVAATAVASATAAGAIASPWQRQTGGDTPGKRKQVQPVLPEGLWQPLPEHHGQGESPEESLGGHSLTDSVRSCALARATFSGPLPEMKNKSQAAFPTKSEKPFSWQGRWLARDRAEQLPFTNTQRTRRAGPQQQQSASTPDLQHRFHATSRSSKTSPTEVLPALPHSRSLMG
jgi:hypothetical protein